MKKIHEMEMMDYDGDKTCIWAGSVVIAPAARRSASSLFYYAAAESACWDALSREAEVWVRTNSSHSAAIRSLFILFFWMYFFRPKPACP